MHESTVEIPPSEIAADLHVPAKARGVVLFAHGSGSSRLSLRNRFVAEYLQRSGFATLLIDLLTAAEDELDRETRMLRFDIDLLASRLAEATQWARKNHELKEIPQSYFGASTGAAAALVAETAATNEIRAIVSRGGRPDLAEGALQHVRAATLLIIGSEDGPVIDLNRQALNQLQCERELAIVPGATHLFEEPGALEQVAALAVQWFNRYSE